MNSPEAIENNPINNFNFSLTCPHCRAQSLVAVLVQGSVPAKSTDLLPGEGVRFRDGPQVGADDLLDLHQFLTDFDGDFKALFGT